MKHISNPEIALKVLKKVPQHKLFIIDNKINNLKEVIEIYQDFEDDIYNSLEWFLAQGKKVQTVHHHLS